LGFKAARPLELLMKLNRAMFFIAPFLPTVLGQVSGNAGSGIAPDVLRNFTASADKEVREDILRYWLDHTRDRRRGGFYGVITADGTVVPDAPRGALLTSRILWTFSAAYRHYRDPQYLEMATWAYRDLLDRFWDKENGGLYWEVSPEGRPTDPRKQIYGQVFGIYAFAEYFRATGEKAALDRAIEIYRLVELHAKDPVHGGYFEVYSNDWVRNEDASVGLIGRDDAKSQNTHIHILEAYTNLLRVWPDSGLRESQRALTEIILDRIIDPKTHHLVLFLDAAWKPVSSHFSYGHDIELSWLVVEAAHVLGDPALVSKAEAMALKIADTTLREGIDGEGGVYNEGTVQGVTDAGKEWWPQAEAVVGFLNAYQISRDPRYFAASIRTWRFIQDKFVDRRQGDWYQTLDAANEMRPRPKVTVWKCPYHNSRCCLEAIERLGELSGDKK
jgi:mannobiose 2-epimerase